MPVTLSHIFCVADHTEEVFKNCNHNWHVTANQHKSAILEVTHASVLIFTWEISHHSAGAEPCHYCYEAKSARLGVLWWRWFIWADWQRVWFNADVQISPWAPHDARKFLQLQSQKSTFYFPTHTHVILINVYLNDVFWTFIFDRYLIWKWKK